MLPFTSYIFYSHVDWEGRGRRCLPIRKDSLRQPFAVSFFRQSLYWTDWKDRHIHTYNSTTSSSSPSLLRFRHQLDPMDIKVFEPDRQPVLAPEELPCAEDNGGCSHLCLPADHAAKYTCACPTGENEMTFHKRGKYH